MGGMFVSFAEAKETNLQAGGLCQKPAWRRWRWHMPGIQQAIQAAGNVLRLEGDGTVW